MAFLVQAWSKKTSVFTYNSCTPHKKVRGREGEGRKEREGERDGGGGERGGGGRDRESDKEREREGGGGGLTFHFHTPDRALELAYFQYVSLTNFNLKPISFALNRSVFEGIACCLS